MDNNKQVDQDLGFVQIEVTGYDSVIFTDAEAFLDLVEVLWMVFEPTDWDVGLYTTNGRVYVDVVPASPASDTELETIRTEAIDLLGTTGLTPVQ